MQQQAHELTERFLAQARGMGIDIPPVRLRFDLRGTTAGQAILRDPRQPEIRLNAQLLAENGAEFLNRTIPHEVAHLAAYYRKGRRPQRPHGPEWQALMQSFGLVPERCHRYDVSRARVRRLITHTYRCACRTHELSSIRHNRIGRGETRYHCRSCGQELRPG